MIDSIKADWERNNSHSKREEGRTMGREKESGLKRYGEE